MPFRIANIQECREQPGRAERNAERGEKGENSRDLPFRLIAIVESRKTLRSVIETAADHPKTGFGLMLRDSEHREGVVRVLAREALAQEPSKNIWLISNGCRVEGIGWRHLTAAEVRAGVAPSGPFGCSVHSREELVAAGRLNPNYILLSPIFSTDSKPGAAPLGVDALREFSAAALAPIIALGGIVTVERAALCLAAGAFGVAGITLFEPKNESMLKGIISLLEGLEG